MAEKTQFFYNFTYIDPIQKEIRRKMKMLVKGDKIDQISEGDDISTAQLPLETVKIDLKGQYVMPGLIDVHCHLSGSGKKLPKFFSNDRLVSFLQQRTFFQKMIYKTMKANALAALLSGTTTVRSLGDAHLCVLDLRDRIQANEEQGARIFASGKAISLKGTHGKAICLEITSETDAKTVTQQLIDHGVDCLKIMATGAVTGATTLDGAGKPELSIEIMRIICDLAHQRDLKVTAHCESIEGAWNCVQTGVDSLEHGSNYDAELLDEMAKKSIATIPTLAAGLAYTGHSRKETGLSEIEVLNDHRISKNIKIGLHRAISHGGVLIGAGDDAGIPLVLHGKIAQEIKMLHTDFGLDFFDSIRCGTINNAKIMGREDLLGSLDIGKYADFITFISEHNPKENMDLLFHPDEVYKSGIKIR